jgi:hypothetical protein
MCSKKYNLIKFSTIFLENKFIMDFIFLLNSLFFFNKNILIVDFFNNFNYLPLNNETIFDRSSKKLSKIIKYFNINAVVFLNINKKKFIFKKLFNFKLLNISSNRSYEKNKFDFHFDIPNTKLHSYIVYLIILKLYLRVKNK